MKNSTSGFRNVAPGDGHSSDPLSGLRGVGLRLPREVGVIGVFVNFLCREDGDYEPWEVLVVRGEDGGEDFIDNRPLTQGEYEDAERRDPRLRQDRLIREQVGIWEPAPAAVPVPVAVQVPRGRRQRSRAVSVVSAAGPPDPAPEAPSVPRGTLDHGRARVAGWLARSLVGVGAGGAALPSAGWEEPEPHRLVVTLVLGDGWAGACERGARVASAFALLATRLLHDDYVRRHGREAAVLETAIEMPAGLRRRLRRVLVDAAVPVSRARACGACASGVWSRRDGDRATVGWAVRDRAEGGAA